MRIVSGTLGGRFLAFNNKRQGNARVTAGMVKEAVFSSLGDLTGLRFLDLFACSGQMGLEAYSRGAQVVMNEKDRRRYQFVRGVLDDWDLRAIQLFQRPAERLLPELARDGQCFDVVYLDPPYHETHDGKPMAVAFLDLVIRAGVLHPQARVMVQHDVRVEVPEPEGLKMIRHKKYGDTFLTTFQCL